jgi:hypothetical protein
MSKNYFFTDGPLPSVLQEVDLPIMENTECESMYEKAGYRCEYFPTKVYASFLF